MDAILEQSSTLASLMEQQRIAIVGGMYDVATGNLEVLTVENRRQAAEPLALQEPLSIMKERSPFSSTGRAADS